MNNRLPSDTKTDAMEAGEFAGRARMPWTANPETDPRLRREWLHGWIREAFGDAMSRNALTAIDLRDRYLAVFPVEQSSRKNQRWSAEEREFLEVARRIPASLPYEAIGAALLRPRRTCEVEACRLKLTARAA